MSEKGTEQKRSTMGRVLKMSGVVLAAAAAAGAAVAGNAIANQDAPEGPRVVATAPANLDTVPATLPPPDKMVVTIPVTETSSGSTILPIVGEAVQIEPADQAAIDDVGGISTDENGVIRNNVTGEPVPERARKSAVATTAARGAVPAKPARATTTTILDPARPGDSQGDGNVPTADLVDGDFGGGAGSNIQQPDDVISNAPPPTTTTTTAG